MNSKEKNNMGSLILRDHLLFVLFFSDVDELTQFCNREKQGEKNKQTGSYWMLEYWLPIKQKSAIKVD